MAGQICVGDSNLDTSSTQQEIGQFPNVQRETASVPAGVKASQYTSSEELRIRKKLSKTD